MFFVCLFVCLFVFCFLFLFLFFVFVFFCLGFFSVMVVCGCAGVFLLGCVNEMCMEVTGCGVNV